MAALVFFQASTELLPKQFAQAPRSVGFRLVWNQFTQESKGGTKQLSARHGNALVLALLASDFFLPRFCALVDRRLRFCAEQHFQPPFQFLHSALQVERIDFGFDIQSRQGEFVFSRERGQKILFDGLFGDQDEDLDGLFLAHAMRRGRCAARARPDSTGDRR